MEAVLQNIASVDRVIHAPPRLMLMAILTAAESADFLYLQRETGLTKGNLSANLSKLEEAGYIEIDKTYRGKIPATLCRLTEPGRAAFRAYRRQLKKILEEIE